MKGLECAVRQVRDINSGIRTSRSVRRCWLPPVWPNQTLPSKNSGHGIHHPVYGVKMKDKADKLGVECHLLIRGVSESKKFQKPDDFILDVLLKR